MKNVRDARRIIVEMSKVIMKEEDTLNMHKNMLRKVREKSYIMNEEITEENEGEIEKDDENVNAIKEAIIEPINRKEKDWMLSTRRKKHRIREVKNLLMKIANPESNNKEDLVNQCAHVLEDTLEETHETKG